MPKRARPSGAKSSTSGSETRPMRIANARGLNCGTCVSVADVASVVSSRSVSSLSKPIAYSRRSCLDSSPAVLTTSASCRARSSTRWSSSRCRSGVRRSSAKRGLLGPRRGGCQRGGASSQRIEERDERLAVGRRERPEAVAGAGPFAAVRRDRLLQRLLTSVVQEALGVAQVDERLGAELRRRRPAEADVGELRPHVVQEQVGVGGELLPVERMDGARARAQRRHVTGGATDLREQVATAPPLLAALGGPGRGGEPTKPAGKPSGAWGAPRSGQGAAAGGVRLPP